MKSCRSAGKIHQSSTSLLGRQDKEKFIKKKKKKSKMKAEMIQVLQSMSPLREPVSFYWRLSVYAAEKQMWSADSCWCLKQQYFAEHSPSFLWFKSITGAFGNGFYLTNTWSGHFASARRSLHYQVEGRMSSSKTSESIRQSWEKDGRSSGLCRQKNNIT